MIGVDKVGLYYLMCGFDMFVICICEGFVMGVVLWDCWFDNFVIVVWDVVNLKFVVWVMVVKYLDVWIVICGDND